MQSHNKGPWIFPWAWGTSAGEVDKSPHEIILEQATGSNGKFNKEDGTLAEEAEKEAFKQALTIFHKDVRDTNGAVQPFTIRLKVGDGTMTGISWSKSSHPMTPTENNSPPDLQNANTASASLDNLGVGGVYHYNLDAFAEQTAVQIWLPTAGPDISQYWEAEIAYFRNAWGPAYRTRLTQTVQVYDTEVERLRMMAAIALADMLALGPNLDWADVDDIHGSSSTSGLANIIGGKTAGDQDRFTLHGIVIDFAKRNNMMYALIGREMGIAETTLLNGPDWKDTINKLFNLPNDAGSRDSDAAKESYRAGFDVFTGNSLSTVMQNRGIKMQEPNMRAAKEWPSLEMSDGSLLRVAEEQLNTMIQ